MLDLEGLVPPWNGAQLNEHDERHQDTEQQDGTDDSRLPALSVPTALTGVAGPLSVSTVLTGRWGVLSNHVRRA